MPAVQWSVLQFRAGVGCRHAWDNPRADRETKLNDLRAAQPPGRAERLEELPGPLAAWRRSPPLRGAPRAHARGRRTVPWMVLWTVRVQPLHPWLRRLCRARTCAIALSWCFLCPLHCSPILVYQAADDLSALDPGGHIDRFAGLMQRRSLFPRLVRPVLVIVPRVLGQSPPEVRSSAHRLVHGSPRSAKAVRRSCTARV
jgi:hypothetical protein